MLPIFQKERGGMMKYKRITTKDEEGNWQVWEDDYSHPFEALQYAIDRLAERRIRCNALCDCL